MNVIKADGIAIVIVRMQAQGARVVAKFQGTVTLILNSPQVARSGMKQIKIKD
jgi:hypothetical protein